MNKKLASFLGMSALSMTCLAGCTNNEPVAVYGPAPGSEEIPVVVEESTEPEESVNEEIPSDSTEPTLGISENTRQNLVYGPAPEETDEDGNGEDGDIGTIGESIGTSETDVDNWDVNDNIFDRPSVYGPAPDPIH